MAGISPTQNTLKNLRERGYICQVTEHWNSYAGRRVDLFGGIDVLGCKKGKTLGVQATSWTNISARRAKLRELPGIVMWLKAGNLLEIQGWKKVCNQWTVKIEPVTLDSLKNST